MDGPLYPFSKNRYFNNKRLRSTDFIRDQRFADSKLSFLNHWVMGEGIMAGLGVRRIGSEQLLIEPGFAVDGCGRFIVVDRETVYRLQKLDGLNELRSGNAVLWLRYDETEESPVAVVENNLETERMTVAWERFAFSLRDPVELEPPAAERLLFSVFILYQDDGLRVTQCIPNIISGIQSTVISLILESYDPEPTRVEIEYHPKIDGFCGRDGGEIRLHQTITLEMGETVLHLPVKPGTAGRAAEVAVQVDEHDLTLTILGRSACGQRPFFQTFPVTPGDPVEALEKTLSVQDLQDLWDATSRGIPIAYVRLLNVGKSRILDEVKPIGSRYRNTPPDLSKQLEMAARCYISEPCAAPNTPVPAPVPPPVPQEMRRMTTGTVTLTAGLNDTENGTVFSDEIVHGLGPGNVYVEFGIEHVYPVANDHRNRTDLLLGDAILFTRDGGRWDKGFDRAVRVHPDKGTFEMAVGIRGRQGYLKLRLRWFAWRLEEIAQPAHDGVLERLEPSMIRVKPGERVQFTPVFSNGGPLPCAYYVEGRQNSGSITRDGLYTAPNRPGLVMISAQVEGNPSDSANAFVIVEEKEDEQSGS